MPLSRASSRQWIAGTMASLAMFQLATSVGSSACLPADLSCQEDTGTATGNKTLRFFDANNGTHRGLAQAAEGEWFASSYKEGVYYKLFTGDWEASDDSKALPTRTMTCADDAACTERCAKECFVHQLCNYFGATDKECHLDLVTAATAASASSPPSQFGYMLMAPPSMVGRAVPCATPIQIAKISKFCGDDKLSYYFDQTKAATAGMCAVDKMTLFRAAQVSYYTTQGATTMAAKLKSDKLFNAAELAPDTIEAGGFSLEQYLKLTNNQEELQITAKNVHVIDAAGNIDYADTATTKWTYSLDTHGRVTSASAPVTKATLLQSVVGANGLSVHRDTYCDPNFQSRFNLIHHKNQADFQAGHVVACQFTNPHGFWNFVVQNELSNGHSHDHGCWGNSELKVNDLLASGCHGKFQAELKYFDDPEEAAAFDGDKLLFPPALAKEHYETPVAQAAAADQQKADDHKCSFFYRPHTMNLKFTITGADDGSRCAAVWPVIKQRKANQLFTVTGDALVMTRSMAHWALEAQTGPHVQPIHGNELTNDAVGVFLHIATPKAKSAVVVKVKGKAKGKAKKGGATKKRPASPTAASTKKQRKTKKTRALQVSSGPIQNTNTTAITATANHLNALTVDLARAAAEVTRVRWDKAKTTLRVQTLRARHAAVHTATRSHKQRVKRLREQLKAAKIQAVRPTRSGPATVDSVAEDLAMLDLDPTTRVERVRQALIHVRYERAQRRRQTKFAQYEGTGPAATRAFYKRISMRFGSAPLARLAPDPTRTSNPADRLAEDWRVITQQAPPSQELQDRLFETLPAKPAVNDFRYLTSEFTAAEVEKAIRASPRGKASGPDGIPNDWYRENAADMAVIMAPVYTQWLRSGRVPTSFKHATIFCIPKVKQPATGLDYRPIALLNSDYKIFSRLLLNRLRPDLGKLVSNAQFGFVPDRQVHDAVDVWTAAKKQVTDGNAATSTMALLLDFAKAYDTLDRRFLEKALQRHGLPRDFVRTVMALHRGTTAEFLASGQLSKTESIQNGIRQGCPLAPVLFVLALDVLYELIDANASVTGVDLGAAKPTKIAGYADDTTLFLGSPSEEPAALETLRIFAEVSGLKVNVHKSVAVCLHPMGHTQELHEMVIPVAAATQHTRLLGVQVASDPWAAHVWDTTIQQLRARLHLAAIKTTSVIQRVGVARAVIMPKILYIARHEWPSPATVEKLQTFTNNYIWNGVLVADQRQGRAWMSRAVAQLPARDGGLSIPNLRLELQLLSAKTVERWHRPAAGLGTHVGRILTRPTRLHDPPENPITRHEPTNVHHRATPLDTGIDFLQQHMTQPRSDGEKECLAELQRQVRPGSWRTQWWSDGWLHRNYNEHRATLVAMQVYQNSEHGTLDKWCLFATRATKDAILLGTQGTTIQARMFHGLFAPTATIGEVLDMEWIANGTVRFRCKTQPYPLAPRHAVAFRNFCDILVTNYPALLMPQNDQDMLQVLPAGSMDQWRLQPATTGYDLIRQPVAGASQLIGNVTTTRAATQAAKKYLQGDHARFARHPWLDAVAPLWRDDTEPPPKLYKTRAYAQAAKHGKNEVAGRATRMEQEDVKIGSALTTLTWRHIAQLRGSTAHQRELMHRIKGQRISGWDGTAGKRGCPHCPLLGTTGGDTTHIFWYCPHAQQRWMGLRAVWRGVGAWMPQSDDDDFLHAVFSLRLPRVPAAVWTKAAPTTTNQRDRACEIIELHATTQQAWQQHVLGTLSLLRRWRNSKIDPATSWNDAQTALAPRLASGNHAPAVHVTTTCHTQPQGLPDASQRHLQPT